MRHWLAKFGNAFRGVWFGSVGQSSFAVHIPMAIAVVGLAAYLRCSLEEWCILLFCITLVVSMEFLNSAIELLAKGLCKERSREVGKSLDIASAAVLIASLGAAIIGILVLGSRFLQL